MKEDKRIRDVLDLIDPPIGFKPWYGGPALMGCSNLIPIFVPLSAK